MATKQPGQQPGQQPERATGASGGRQGMEQERRRDVSRETRPPEGTGSAETQRSAPRTGAGAMSRGAGGGRGLGESSLLPTLMANPGLMASAFMSNPYAFAQAMSQEMNRLFDSMEGSGVEGGLGRQGGAMTGGARGASSGMGSALARGGMAGGTQRHGSWVPQMEIRQRGNELIVCADLPGLDAHDVHIDVEDGILTIAGERRHSAESDEGGYFRSERSYGSFSRAIPLPDGVDEEAVQAQFDNGVLEVRVPLPEQRSKARRIEVRSGARPAAGGKGADRAASNPEPHTGGPGRDASGGMEIRPGEVGG